MLGGAKETPFSPASMRSVAFGITRMTISFFSRFPYFQGDRTDDTKLLDSAPDHYTMVVIERLITNFDLKVEPSSTGKWEGEGFMEKGTIET